MPTPKRPLNICQRCNYTWYPRGKDRSLRCPQCRYHDISTRYEGWFYWDWDGNWDTGDWEFDPNALKVLVIAIAGIVGTLVWAYFAHALYLAIVAKFPLVALKNLFVLMFLGGAFYCLAKIAEEDWSRK